jgi:hypothetical protein
MKKGASAKEEKKKGKKRGLCLEDKRTIIL